MAKKLALSLAFLIATSLAVFSGLFVMPGVTHADSYCQVTYTVTSQWSGGFGATITIQNTSGSAWSSWNLQFVFPASGQTVTQGWNGAFSQSGQNVTVTNLAWNGSVAANASVSPGFNGSWTTSNPVPTRFIVNGHVCNDSSGGTTPTPTPYTTPTATPTTGTTPTPTPTIGAPPTPPSDVRPVVSFTSPAQFATFSAGTPIQIGAEASISSGHITHVDFQAEPNSGTNPIISLGSDTTAPYSVTWSNPPTGVFVLIAMAYSDGPYATEVTERIAITPDGLSPFPMVNITSPSDGAQFVSPATIQASASVTIGSGTISRVDFSLQGNNASYQGTATSAPYSVTWNNIFPGTYTLNAVAYADTSVGVVGNTVSIQVVVNNGPPPGGCFVKYSVTQFGTGFLADLTIINGSSTTINGWKLVFTFPGNQQVLSAFNSSFTQVGHQVTMTNASYNGTLAPNGSVNLGFNGTFSGSNPNPTDFTLNGNLCSVV
ncbi:MAG TPA: cellulose binding domain-containing protein [Ktedonobacteraceae bacterium]|nr:cellulose binding domain-containing protein [Ktedonobacteraceae bacterium]